MNFWGANSDRDYDDYIHMHDEPREYRENHSDGTCECHCPKCHKSLEPYGQYFHRCGDCEGGK
jgi:hypothetical protein